MLRAWGKVDEVLQRGNSTYRMENGKDQGTGGQEAYYCSVALGKPGGGDVHSGSIRGRTINLST